MLDRVAVFPAAPVTTFLALLLELLLSLGVGKAEAELHAIMVDWEAMEVLDGSFSNFTGLKSVVVSMDNDSAEVPIPSEANFFADT